MDPQLVVLIAVIALALIFDFINGFHDSANSIATIVSTRVLTPMQAVAMAAFFNFISFVVFPLAVADTVAKIVDKGIVDNAMISAALIGACGWNLFTWYIGMPSSSSHALMGGLVGAAVTRWYFTPDLYNNAELSAKLLNWPSINKTLLFIVLAPAIGMFLGATIALTVRWIIYSRTFRLIAGPVIGAAIALVAGGWSEWTTKPWVVEIGTGHFFNLGLSPTVWGIIVGGVIAVGIPWMFRNPTPARIKSIFHKGQICSAAFYSIGHGGNDAQKTMGIIIALLVSAHYITVPKGEQLSNHVPMWVILSCQAAMGLGTLFGGWKIVKTMGTRLMHLRPVDGFCAEFGAAVTLVLTATPWLKVPVSTTQTITGSIVGVGTINSVGGVKWDTFERIIWTWVLTIPGAFVMAALMWFALSSLPRLGG